MKGTMVGAIKVFFKMLPEVYVFNLLIRVEVESDMSIIGSTFHKRGTLLKKK